MCEFLSNKFEAEKRGHKSINEDVRQRLNLHVIQVGVTMNARQKIMRKIQNKRSAQQIITQRHK